MIKRLSVLLTAIIILQACSSSQMVKQSDDIQIKIDNLFEDSLFSHAHWGVKIESLESGKVLYERNADRLFMPASNQKIPTAAAALLNLGPNYKFETKLYYTGEIKDSVLHGDLIIQGSGDPTFYTRFFDDPRSPFYEWIDFLKTKGIHKINGNIIGDDNLWDDEYLGYGWAHNGLDVWYSAEFSALQFNENYVDLKIIPPANKNESVQIIPNVDSKYFTIIQNIEVVDSGYNRVRITRDFNTNEIVVAGKVVAGSKSFERSPSIHNPTHFTSTVLLETMEENKIIVEGEALDCDEISNYSLENAELIYTHYSPPLAEILKILMKRSQNLYAETMVRTIALHKDSIGSFAGGREVIRETLESFGIPNDEYAYMDGSGLSRYNYISPNQLVKILKAMQQSQYSDVWMDIQPIAGVDGTLRRRMKGTAAEGNVRAKTGTISNVRGLSGYVTDSDGEEYVFSFLVNGHLRSSRDTEIITDRVLELIANYSK